MKKTSVKILEMKVKTIKIWSTVSKGRIFKKIRSIWRKYLGNFEENKRKFL